jgi:ketosteroid isomerase-like protein
LDTWIPRGQRDGMDTDRTPAALAETYFRCWVDGDFVTLRCALADDATCEGPLGTAGDAAACVAGLRGMRERLLTDLVVRHRFVDGPDVLTWFDLHTSVAPPAPTANWIHVEDGRISRIRVTFDPRPLLEGRPS